MRGIFSLRQYGYFYDRFDDLRGRLGDGSLVRWGLNYKCFNNVDPIIAKLLTKTSNNDTFLKVAAFMR